jgi:hypothetical protein
MGLTELRRWDFRPARAFGTRTGLRRHSNRSLLAGRNSAAKEFGEARDWAGVFGDTRRFRVTETAPSRIPRGKAAESQRLFRRRRETAMAQDCVVAEAVLIGPVSASIFPANREKNREFRENRPTSLMVTSFLQASSMICERIPYAIEQGIFPRNREFSRRNREAARMSSELRERPFLTQLFCSQRTRSVLIFDFEDGERYGGRASGVAASSSGLLAGAS